MAYLKYDCSAGQEIPFMELHSQELAIGPHPRPDEYRPHIMFNQAPHHEQVGAKGSSRWRLSVSFMLLALYC
jgi:hypothetical protein